MRPKLLLLFIPLVFVFFDFLRDSAQHARCLQLTRKIYVDAPSLAKSVAEPQQRRHPSERAVGASANELHTYTSTVICLTLSPAGHVNDAPTERKENKFHFFFGKEKVGAVFFDVSGPRSGT